MEKLIKEQIDVFFQIQNSGFNIVTCGNCGTVLLHKINNEEHIDCFGCHTKMAKSDCPDYWTEGDELSTEFKQTN